MQYVHARRYSSHHLQLVINFLKKNIKPSNRPGNSPDLNPIENLCAVLKDKVADEHSTSAKYLGMAMKGMWTQNIITKYCKHLVLSRPCRLQAVIKNKDGHTKY